jgi:hypothetical protein
MIGHPILISAMAEVKNLPGANGHSSRKSAPKAL